MARLIEQQLYRALIDSEFTFIPRGRVEITDIYDAVKRQFNDLCDDVYQCYQNCWSGNRQPEWNHTVRKALDRMKRISDSVQHSGTRGYWIFL